MKTKLLSFHAILAVTTLVGIFLFFTFRTNTDFLEYSQIGGSESYVKVISPEQTLSQSFVNPYETVAGIQVRIGTLNKTNMAEWTVRLVEANTGKEVHAWTQIGRSFVDNQFHDFRLDAPIRVTPGLAYTIIIDSENVNDGNGLVFYASNTPADGKQAVGGLVQNSTMMNMTLSLRVVGGNVSDGYWVFVNVLITGLLLMLLLRLRYVNGSKSVIVKDIYLQAMAISGLSMLLLMVFLGHSEFTDEFDIFHAGLAMAKGNVLYRDYVCQHPPVTMFLSALFAKLGANSTQMFRLLYYITVSLLYGGLYYRHKEYFGGRRLAFFLSFSIVVVFSLHNRWMLGDNMAALGALMVLMEFIRYQNDRRIAVSRCIYISLGIYISVGSTFLSIYPMAWMAFVFFASELVYQVHRKESSAKVLVARYVPLVSIVIAPFAVTVAYFAINGALHEAVRQIYSFNREVYVHYNGLGGSVFTPLLNAVSNMVGFYMRPVAAIFNAEFSAQILFELTMGLLFLRVLIQYALKKKWLFCAGLLGYAVLLTSRGTGGFHSSHFALVISAASILLLRVPKKLSSNPMVLAGTLACLVVVSQPYISSVPSLIAKRQLIKETDYLAAQALGSDGTLYHDYYSHDTLYLEYKVGTPVNRTPYMLPWYMDWYLPWCMEDLDAASVVVYNPNREVWGKYQYSDFSRDFNEKLLAEFEQESDMVWIRK